MKKRKTTEKQLTKSSQVNRTEEVDTQKCIYGSKWLVSGQSWMSTVPTQVIHQCQKSRCQSKGMVFQEGSTATDMEDGT